MYNPLIDITTGKNIPILCGTFTLLFSNTISVNIKYFNIKNVFIFASSNQIILSQ